MLLGPTAREKSSDLHKSLQISIIITSYSLGRLNDIRELLDTLAAQTHRIFETIFVAEGSQSLAQGVEAHAQRLGLPLIIKFNHGEPGLSLSRNLGASVASGDVLGFIDDDVVLANEWGAAVVQTFQNPDVIGVTGPVEPLWEGEPINWLPEEFHWLLSCTTWAKWDSPREIRNAWGMNMAFRREAFEDGRGFSPKFGLRDGGRAPWLDPPSEDVDFSLRVRRASGKCIIFNPSVRVWHHIHAYRFSLKFIAHRAATVGNQRRMIRQLYPPEGFGERLLATEVTLLQRVMKDLLPNTIALAVQHPVLAARRLFITVFVMVFVAMGYLWPLTRRRS